MQKTGHSIKNLPIRLFKCQIFKYLEFKDVLKLKVTCKYFNKKFNGYRYINKLSTKEDLNKVLEATNLYIRENKWGNLGVLGSVIWLHIYENSRFITNFPPGLINLIIEFNKSNLKFNLQNKIKYVTIENNVSFAPIILPPINVLHIGDSTVPYILYYSKPEVITTLSIENQCRLILQEFVFVCKQITAFHKVKCKITAIKFRDNKFCYIYSDTVKILNLFYNGNSENNKNRKCAYSEILIK